MGVLSDFVDMYYDARYAFHNPLDVARQELSYSAHRHRSLHLRQAYRHLAEAKERRAMALTKRHSLEAIVRELEIMQTRPSTAKKQVPYYYWCEAVMSAITILTTPDIAFTPQHQHAISEQLSQAERERMTYAEQPTASPYGMY